MPGLAAERIPENDHPIEFRQHAERTLAVGEREQCGVFVIAVRRRPFHGHAPNTATIGNIINQKRTLILSAPPYFSLIDFVACQADIVLHLFLSRESKADRIIGFRVSIGSSAHLPGRLFIARVCLGQDASSYDWEAKRSYSNGHGILARYSAGDISTTSRKVRLKDRMHVNPHSRRRTCRPHFACAIIDWRKMEPMPDYGTDSSCKGVLPLNRKRKYCT